MNNILMITSIFSIFLGVTYPLIIESISGDKVSIGPPYYNTIFAPIILIASIFIMISVDAAWQRSMSLRNISLTAAIPSVFSLIITYVVWYATGIFSILAYIGIFSSFLILTSYFVRVITNLFHKRFINKGSAIAHIGVVLLFFVLSMNRILIYDNNVNIS